MGVVQLLRHVSGRLIFAKPQFSPPFSLPSRPVRAWRTGGRGDRVPLREIRLKVLGVSGSPRREGNTASLLSQMLSAATERSAEVETVFLHGLRLSPCQGCYHCEVTGVCVIRDAMMDLCEKIRDCDALVLASPVYFHHATAQMKLFLDRLYPLIDVKNRSPSRRRAGKVIKRFRLCAF